MRWKPFEPSHPNYLSPVAIEVLSYGQGCVKFIGTVQISSIRLFSTANRTNGLAPDIDAASDTRGRSRNNLSGSAIMLSVVSDVRRMHRSRHPFARRISALPTAGTTYQIRLEVGRDTQCLHYVYLDWTRGCVVWGLHSMGAQRAGEDVGTHWLIFVVTRFQSMPLFLCTTTTTMCMPNM